MNKDCINCERCGCSFKKIDNLRKHFNRIFICKPLVSNISVSSLIYKYATQKGIYKCESCGKLYKTRAGKSKHRKTCIIALSNSAKKDIIIQEQNEIIEEKDTKLQNAFKTIQQEQLIRENLEKKIKELLSNQCIQNITNNNNFIIINNFGEENIDYICHDSQFIQKCIENPIHSVQTYLDIIHFNKEHPENNNIKLTNLQSPFMDYFKNGNWKKIEQNILIPRIINKSISTIHNMISNVEDDEINKWYQFRNNLSNKKNPLNNTIKTKTKRVIYNNTVQFY